MDFNKRTEELKKRLEELEMEKQYIASEAQLREKEKELKELTKEIHPSKLREFVMSIKSMMNELHEYAENRRKEQELAKVT